MYDFYSVRCGNKLHFFNVFFFFLYPPSPSTITGKIKPFRVIAFEKKKKHVQSLKINNCFSSYNWLEKKIIIIINNNIMNSIRRPGLSYREADSSMRRPRSVFIFYSERRPNIITCV